MVELINTDLSQPLPEGSSLNLTPRQTHPAPPAAQQQQARPEVQASPQAQLGFVRSAQADCSSSGRQAGSPGQQQGEAVRLSATTPDHSEPCPALTTQLAHALCVCAGGVCAAVLRQRVAAIESLSAIADALRAAKPGLRQRLSASGLAREVEGYFARTVDAAADLRDAIYTSGAKQLMPVREWQGAGVARGPGAARGCERSCARMRGWPRRPGAACVHALRLLPCRCWLMLSTAWLRRLLPVRTMCESRLRATSRGWRWWSSSFSALPPPLRRQAWGQTCSSRCAVVGWVSWSGPAQGLHTGSSSQHVPTAPHRPPL
jgi:hypothetical protein